MKVFYDKDADLNLLKDKRITVIGYGSQGHAHANNLKDSGFDVVVGLSEDSLSHAKAKETGLETMYTRDAAGLAALIQAGFETLTEAGYSPEMAYFECLHEMKLIVDLLYEGGIGNMRYSVSNTAEYGDLTRGNRIVGPAAKAEMKKILSEIQSGEFADEWISECDSGKERFKRLEKAGEAHEIEEVGTRLRAMMPWLSKDRLVNTAKN